MTVCIAALCDAGKTVVCASDRMLTAARRIEFEPPVTKVWSVAHSVVLLVAGDAGVQSEISDRVWASIEANDAIPQPRVSDVVDLYAKHYGELRQEAAERDVLVPLGLDYSSYLGRQGELGADFVRMVGEALLEYRLPHVETIIAGVDSVGGALYRVVDTNVACCNYPGFACIGSGGWIADAQFMLGGHAARNGFPETLWLTYLAKRRAEVASGVGQDTDVFLIPGPGKSSLLSSTWLAELARLYDRVRQQEQDVVKAAEVELATALNTTSPG